MKEIIVIISLLLLLVGIVLNYNAGNFLSTNLITAGIVGIVLTGLFSRSQEPAPSK